MRKELVTGRTARSAAVRGLLLGLLLQALLVGALQLAGPPMVDGGLVAISGPPGSTSTVATLVQAQR